MKFLIVEPSPLPILLGPNIRLRILFTNTLSLRSFYNVRDHVTQPYITTGNIPRALKKPLKVAVEIVPNI